MRKLKGKIISDKMDKTRVVEVVRLKKHPTYSKYFKVNKKFKAHDEKNLYKEGDEVVIRETRPISKDKRWIIVGKRQEKIKNKKTSESPDKPEKVTE